MQGLRESGLELTPTEARLAFAHFDVDGSGSVSFEEFVQGMRDPLTPRRLALVHQAFKQIDKDGNGVLEPADVVGAYDASKHPEVIAGRMTPDQVLQEFLETFDVGGEVDGKVTKEEFVNYYTNVGANIDDDDYFELMIRNAWHISGGEGWCANTANRRVLVTHADGRQSVEEIKNDMGLKADDKAGMMARLKAQGVNAANISTFDGGDDNDKGAPSHFHDVKESMSAGSAQGARSFAAGGTGRKPGAGGGVFASSISIGDGGVSASQKLGLSDRPTGRHKYEDARLLLATDVCRFLAVVVATPNRDVTRRLDTSTSSLSSSVVVETPLLMSHVVSFVVADPTRCRG